MPRGPTCRRAQRAFLCKYLKYLAELTKKKKNQLGSIQCLSVIWMSGAITGILGMMDTPECTLWGCDCHLGLTRSPQVSGRVCLFVCPTTHPLGISACLCHQCGATEPGCCPITCCLPAAGRWVLQHQRSVGLGSFPGSTFWSRQITSHAFFSKIHQLRMS